VSYSTSAKAFQWEGVPELKRLFANLAEAIGPDGMGTAREQLKDALMVPALTIRDEARELAPRYAGKLPASQPPAGTLREAIYAAKGPSDRPGVVVAVDFKKAYYAGFVERGTSKMPAQPYFRPAVTATRPLVANMIAGGLKKLIEEQVEKLAYHPPA
jgi:HK97 gp10 family phage protein